MSEHLFTVADVAEREWWSVRQIADYSDMSHKTIYRCIESGELKAYRLRGLKIRRDDLIAWICSRIEIPKVVETVAAGERQPHDPFWD